MKEPDTNHIVREPVNRKRPGSAGPERQNVDEGFPGAGESLLKCMGLLLGMMSVVELVGGNG